MLYKTKTPLGKDGKALKQSGKGVLGYLESLQLAYNANHELIKSIKIKQTGGLVDITTTTYQYDAFGRRIAKHSKIQNQSILTFNNKRILKHGTVQHTPTKKQSTFMLWDGNRQLQEQTDTHVFTTIYEQDSFEPVARLAWLHADLLQSANDEIIKAERESWEPEPELIPNIQVYHYHNDHLGTPNELTNQDGEVVWLADYEAWGNTAKVVYKEIQLHNIAVSADELQPLRFQGQFIDQETGLHYNRFRYYDPDLGMFISRDPIGLMGGDNVFQYAPNPVGWIDPFGLDNKPKNSPKFDKWMDKGGTAWSEIDTRTVVYKDWEGNVVRYPDGYPDFKGGGYVVQEVNVDGLKGNHQKGPSGDFGKADAKAIQDGGTKADYTKNTWHHHQNRTTMQEIDKTIHRRFSHIGGVSGIKNNDPC